MTAINEETVSALTIIQSQVQKDLSKISEMKDQSEEAIKRIEMERDDLVDKISTKVYIKVIAAVHESLRTLIPDMMRRFMFPFLAAPIPSKS